MTSVTLIGPGAIGCAVAGALVDRDGVDLSIAARTPFERLRVEGPTPAVDAAIDVRTDPNDLDGPADVVLLATKTHQTSAAGRWLEAVCGPETVVGVLQNGIGQRELVAPWVGDAAVAPAGVFLPADRLAPGHVATSLPATLRFPDDDAGRPIAGLFEGTYVDVHLDADFHTTAWSKLVSNCAVGAITTLTRTPNSVLADGEAGDLVRLLAAEAVAVAIADGAALTPELADAIAAIVVERAGSHVSSQTADRLAGQPTEWEARQLEVIRRADRHGVDVPNLRMLTTLIRLGEP